MSSFDPQKAPCDDRWPCQFPDLVNPILDGKSAEMIEIWDDCMSFPELLARVSRHKSCRVRYRNLAWQEEEMYVEGDLSELIQHECDHLDGVLAVSKAIDALHSLAYASGYECRQRGAVQSTPKSAMDLQCVKSLYR